ncbi:MAG TPA: hypothetical protein VHG08_16505 [Longimicrobium sp.]|nr:hypothetical protein [Longimicrobium sp.]
MRTLTAQAAMSVCMLVFALLALRIASRVPQSQPTFRYAWTLTGAAFLIRSINALSHDVFATVAYLGGEESRAWAAILVWHPILNHSRTFLITAYCIVFLVALRRAARGLPPPPLRVGVAVVLCGMVVGGLVGWQETTFSGLTHFTAVALWDLMEMLALFAVLFVGLYTATLDRSLWACIGIYTFVLALSVLLFAFLARIDVHGEWAPRASTLQITKALLYLILIGVAARALVKVRRRAPLRSFFEDRSLRTAVPSLHL